MGNRLAPADAVWFLGEHDRNTMAVSAVLWLDREVSRTAVRELLLDRLVHRYPAFRQRIRRSLNPVLLPVWEDDPDFDVDRHLEVVRLPAPGDHVTLEAWCSGERSTALDRHKPLWQVHLLQGYRGDRSVLHFRVHHAIGDGWALVRLLLELADDHRDDTPLVAEETHHLTRDLWRAAGRAAAAAPRLLGHPDELVEHVRVAGDLVATGARLLVPPRPEHNPFIGRPSGSKRMVWDADGLALEEVRDVGRAHHATINDVLLATLAGAQRRYLADESRLVDETMMMVPISLRGQDEPLPRRLGNRLGLLPILLPVGVADPIERLAVVHERMAGLKGSRAPLVSWALLAATALTTPPVERAIHTVNQIRSSGVVTNVPGPRAPLRFAGAGVDGVLGWGGMTGNLDLNWSFFSMTGRVFTGVISDTGITPDPERLLDHFHAEWEVLRSAEARQPQRPLVRRTE